MSKAKIQPKKKDYRPDFVTHSVAAPLALSMVYDYYFGDDEIVESDPLDAAAYAAWADELQSDE